MSLFNKYVCLFVIEITSLFQQNKLADETKGADEPLEQINLSPNELKLKCIYAIRYETLKY